MSPLDGRPETLSRPQPHSSPEALWLGPPEHGRGNRGAFSEARVACKSVASRVTGAEGAGAVFHSSAAVGTEVGVVE